MAQMMKEGISKAESKAADAKVTQIVEGILGEVYISLACFEYQV